MLLLGDDPGETLAYAIFETTEWPAELEKFIPVPVHLQLADPMNDIVVWPAIMEHGRLIYRRRGKREQSPPRSGS